MFRFKFIILNLFIAVLVFSSFRLVEMLFTFLFSRLAVRVDMSTRRWNFGDTDFIFIIVARGWSEKNGGLTFIGFSTPTALCISRTESYWHTAAKNRRVGRNFWPMQPTSPPPSLSVHPECVYGVRFNYLCLNDHGTLTLVGGTRLALFARYTQIIMQAAIFDERRRIPRTAAF